MELRDELNDVKKLWWLHDSYWHATAVRELGEAQANTLNLEANELFFRKYTLMLLKSGQIKRPESIDDLVAIFRKIWASCFFDEMYVHEPVTVDGDEATWVGGQCNAFDSLQAANMTAGYVCGCQALRNGVMKALRLEPVHSIVESLVNGDGRCVIKFSFVPKR
jgi:hypothetical protein